MAKQNRAQKRTVGRVMHEYKHGELERGRGGKVKNPRQAIAIALSEAGASNQQSPSENRRRYSRTKAKERRGQTAQQQKEGRNRRGRPSRERTRAELYREAQKKRIPGRSRMNKAQLERALRG
jgi:hypothetical protein